MKVQGYRIEFRCATLAEAHGAAVLEAVREQLEYTVPVVCVDVDADRERVLNVALNNPTLQGDWDYDKLRSVLVEINTAHVDLELTGFDAAEIQTLTMDLRDDMDGGVPGGDQNGGGGGAPRKDVPQLLVVFEGPGQLAKVREAWGLKKGIKRVHLAECPVARSMFAKLWARASKKGRR
jgi:ParB-like chromosome segregation protein Spo0J